MTFRLRLVLFLVSSLAVLQVVTAVLVYEVTRRHVIGEGEHQTVREVVAAAAAHEPGRRELRLRETFLARLAHERVAAG